jgi:hypothetical protein
MKDGSVFVCGGDTSPFEDGRIQYRAMIYSKGRWRLIEKRMTVNRYDHSCVAMDDGRILITGGGYYAGKTCEVYDPASDDFRRVASMRLTFFHGHKSITLPDGRVLVVGGRSHTKDKWTGRYTCIYDPVADSWRYGGLMNTMRSGNHSLSLSRDGTSVLAVGEVSRIGNVSMSEVYDIATDTWRFAPEHNIPKNPLFDARNDHYALRLEQVFYDGYN